MRSGSMFRFRSLLLPELLFVFLWCSWVVFCLNLLVVSSCFLLFVSCFLQVCLALYFYFSGFACLWISFM